jgi:beta-glucosidase
MPWSKEVAGVLVNFMPGQESGHAIADVLFGKVNPAAKLPITMPNRENEVDFTEVEYPGVRNGSIYHMTYSEKLFVGYRWYDMKNYKFDTGFPFGHGLSYTNFEYSDLQAECGKRDKRHRDKRRRERRTGGGENCQVTFTVTNVGEKAGQEVAQLYVDFPQEAGEPLQLKGFQKTKLLAPGQAEQVVLTLTPRDLSIWDVEQHGWKTVKGLFKTKVGASSRDFRLHGSLTVL